MKNTYVPSLKAHLSFDDTTKPKAIRHSQEYWESDESIPRRVASAYFEQWSETLQVRKETLRNLHRKVAFDDPREQPMEYHLHEEKRLFDSISLSYFQTIHNVPVWRKGLTVSIKENPSRVVGSTNTSEDDVRVNLPDQKIIDSFRRVIEQASLPPSPKSQSIALKPGNGQEATEFSETDITEANRNFSRAFGTSIDANEGEGRKSRQKQAIRATAVIRSRFFIYKYDAKKRYAGLPEPPRRTDQKPGEAEHEHPFIQLPPVAETIMDGQDYLVAELMVKFDSPGLEHIVWLVLMEVETFSILYIKAMVSGVNGLVFTYDPITSTGNTANTSNLNSATLNTFRDDVTLDALDAPVGGVQHLRGTYVEITNVESPNIGAPTKPASTDFDYDVRTNDFAAVSAYYHQTELFQTIESLGFPIASYFDGTTFPIPVDHRGLGTDINAHWVYNGLGGTGHMCYALGDNTDMTNPIGRSVDKWVHWHEMGGHGTLGDHVENGSFGFAHSAGDGLAAFQNDPESLLRGIDMRFRYAPFRPSLDRFFGGPTRTVASGWGWGGSNDIGMSDGYGYTSEQILAATHFQIYRSMGGDSDDVNRRWFASRMATYLVLRAIGDLNEMSNPDTPMEWCEKLIEIDGLNWTTEGLSGGAYAKLIRWAFERRGLYQPAGAHTPVTTPGTPPAVDVYINDGRNGHYDFQPVHWNNVSMWNRTSPDGMPGHQSAILGVTNYMYAKVKNRGTATATNVTVKGYHCEPGAGLTWPTDFVQMGPMAGLPVTSIGPNDSEEITVGPFEWVPNVNTYGHDCVLMIVSTDGDPSNIDNFTAGETIEEWRLVPNDNNIGQRNVQLVPGGMGEAGLMQGLHQRVFFVGNSFRRAAQMELKVELPRVLVAKGWKLNLLDVETSKFRLKAGEKRKVLIELVPGANFTKDEIKNAEATDINVLLYGNDMLMGGMTYRIDPELTYAPNDPNAPKDSRPVDKACISKAADLLKCLKVGDGKVRKVSVKKVTLDIEMNTDCDC